MLLKCSNTDVSKRPIILDDSSHAASQTNYDCGFSRAVHFLSGHCRFIAVVRPNLAEPVRHFNRLYIDSNYSYYRVNPMREMLDEKLNRFEELENQMSDPAVQSEPSKMAAVAREHGSLAKLATCLLYTSPSPRDLSTSRMPSSA